MEKDHQPSSSNEKPTDKKTPQQGGNLVWYMLGVGVLLLLMVTMLSSGNEHKLYWSDLLRLVEASGKGGNGAIYQHTIPSEFASKPGGEWQTVEATMIDNKVTVILNGKKIHDNVVVERATGSELDKNVNEPGPFFLQGDHGTVWFRNIRVKELPKTEAK